MTKTRLSLACLLLSISLACLLLSISLAAAAQDTLEDRKELSISLFAPDLELSGRADLTANDGTTTETFSGRGGVDGGARGGMVEATFRLTQRQRVVGGWYGVRDTDTWNYEGEGAVNDENGDPVDYEHAGQARLKKDFELYRLSYGYDFIQTDRFTTSALVGVYGAKLDLQASNEGYLDSNGEVADLTASHSLKETRMSTTPPGGEGSIQEPGKAHFLPSQPTGSSSRFPGIAS